MKRQKRDRLLRAHSKGYNAGVSGRPKDACPYAKEQEKGQWLDGWKEARYDVSTGLFC